MNSKRKKQLEEMTAEERLEKIHKMSKKDLDYLLELDNSDNVLSPKELEAIYSEVDKRIDRSYKNIKALSITGVTLALLSGAFDLLIGNSSDKS